MDPSEHGKARICSLFVGTEQYTFFAILDSYFAFCALINGREKAPVTFIREAITSTNKFEM